MVEMLGVLAIVGVLSVGGISAYGVAMKKHKANELLHQSSMLATTISAQAMTNDGKLPETITSFGNSSYGNFSTSVTNALDGKGFSIRIENVDSGACTQLEKMAGGMVREATCDGTTATITYYKNLATNDEEGKNGPTGGSAVAGSNIACSAESNTCVGCQTCNEALGKCQDNDSLCPSEDGTPTSCISGSCTCSNLGYSCNGECCPEGTICTYDYANRRPMCAEPVNNGECTTNSDCDSDKYCGFYRDGTTDYIPKQGKCCALPELKEWKYNGRTFWYVEDPLYCRGAFGWNRQNVCMAHGKKLATLSSLGLARNYSYDNCTAKKRFCYYYNEETWEEEKKEISDDTLCKDEMWAEETGNWDEVECMYCSHDCVAREGIGPIRESFGRDACLYLGTFYSETGSARLELCLRSNTESIRHGSWNDYGDAWTLCE